MDKQRALENFKKLKERLQNLLTGTDDSAHKYVLNRAAAIGFTLRV